MHFNKSRGKIRKKGGNFVFSLEKETEKQQAEVKKTPACRLTASIKNYIHFSTKNLVKEISSRP